MESAPSPNSDSNKSPAPVVKEEDIKLEEIMIKPSPDSQELERDHALGDDVPDYNLIERDIHVKVWKCNKCTKEFRHQYTLMRHLSVHTNERKFQCTKCGKSFKQMSTLYQHLAIHSNLRSFVCKVCHKSFNRVSTLNSHVKTHSKYKPHSCHICNKAFHQKGNLRHHIYTHTMERPYKCDMCSRGFNQMSNLMSHKVKVHKFDYGPKYICNSCDEEFVDGIELRNHEQCKHGKQTTDSTSSSNPSDNERGYLLCTDLKPHPYHQQTTGSSSNSSPSVKVTGLPTYTASNQHACNYDEQLPSTSTGSPSFKPRNSIFRLHISKPHAYKYDEQTTTSSSNSSPSAKSMDSVSVSPLHAASKRHAYSYEEQSDSSTSSSSSPRDKSIPASHSYKVSKRRKYKHEKPAASTSNTSPCVKYINGIPVFPLYTHLKQHPYTHGEETVAASGSSPIVESICGIPVSPIKTASMQHSIANNRIPLALLRPSNGIPVLVRVVSDGDQQLLMPATAEEMRKYSHVCRNPNEESLSSGSTSQDITGELSVQLCIPIVARIVPRCREGKMHMDIESPTQKHNGHEDDSFIFSTHFDRLNTE